MREQATECRFSKEISGPEYATAYRRKLALALVALHRQDVELRDCVEATAAVFRVGTLA